MRVVQAEPTPAEIAAQEALERESQLQAELEQTRNQLLEAQVDKEELEIKHLALMTKATNARSESPPRTGETKEQWKQRLRDLRQARQAKMAAEDRLESALQELEATKDALSKATEKQPAKGTSRKTQNQLAELEQLLNMTQTELTARITSERKLTAEVDKLKKEHDSLQRKHAKSSGKTDLVKSTLEATMQSLR